MNQTYNIPAEQIPVLGEFDVVVCGGGPSGCAAAVAAARHGADTLLIEKDGYLGGATVTQLVCVLLSTNGYDFQGIWHEYMREIDRRGGTTGLIRKDNGSMYGTVVPEIVKHAWDQLVGDAGVRVLHHAHLDGAIVEDGCVQGVIAHTRAGRQAVLARRVIDCTGDGHVCHAAGVGWDQGDGEHKYAMALTKVLRLANVKWDDIDFDAARMADVERALDEAIANGEYVTPVMLEKTRLLGYIRGKHWTLPERTGQVMSVISRLLETDPLDPWQVSAVEREGRQQAWEAADFYARHVPGCENAYLLDTSSQVGIRSSRRVHGIETLTEQAVREFRSHPEGIARGSWDIDIWPADSYSSPAVDRDNDAWRERQRRMSEGATYDIPYGCLVARGVDNLLMGGRCISAEHVAESSLRIQQTCMGIGQAAGTAAALSLDANTTPRGLDPMAVVRQLEQDRAAIEPAFDVLRDLPDAK